MLTAKLYNNTRKFRTLQTTVDIRTLLFRMCSFWLSISNWSGSSEQNQLRYKRDHATWAMEQVQLKCKWLRHVFRLHKSLKQALFELHLVAISRPAAKQHVEQMFHTHYRQAIQIPPWDHWSVETTIYVTSHCGWMSLPKLLQYPGKHEKVIK